MLPLFPRLQTKISAVPFHDLKDDSYLFLHNPMDLYHNFYFPAVVDLKEDIWEGRKSANQERIMLLYAGFPGNRDDLRNLVEVFHSCFSPYFHCAF